MPMEILSFRQNNNYNKYIGYLLAVIFMAGNFFYAHVSFAQSSPSEETIRILERWTSAHWGQDCFVWVVHYPEQIATPWAEAEALRSGMSEADKERFRKNFVSELKLDTSETFLVSIYSFGARPVNLSPVRDNISLLASSGERVKPSRYDSSLESPSVGVVQGLVFFPKQNSKDYVIALNGMGQNERIFSFAPPEEPPAKPKPKPEVVVVNLPKKQPKPKPKEEPAPTPPPPPPIPVKPFVPTQRKESSDMELFVKSIHDRKSRDKASEEITTAPLRQSNVDSSYVSRESVLRNFLFLWSDNNGNEMYDMLSDNSKKLISRMNFIREVAKDTAFRSGLKDEYKIDWVGEERAKVITTHKTLVFKSVVTRTLGVTREGSSWRIVW